MIQPKSGRYLVTGAAGFIGGALARRLVENGSNVITIDNLSTGYRDSVPEGVAFIEADCQDPNVYECLPDGAFDAIFHIAGQSSGEVSFDNPSYDLRTNTESTLHLLRFALERGCRRFVYASSMSVYGAKLDRPVTEDEPTVPLSFYGVGKLASEHYMRLFEQYGIRSTALRLFNVYGPGQNLANLRQGMVSIYLAMMLHEGNIHVKGSDARYRDFVYIDDVVDAFLLCLEKDLTHGRQINIGTGRRTTVRELVDALRSRYDRACTVDYCEGTPGDVHGIYADISLAQDILCFRAAHTLEDGLDAMMTWAQR